MVSREGREGTSVYKGFVGSTFGRERVRRSSDPTHAWLLRSTAEEDSKEKRKETIQMISTRDLFSRFSARVHATEPNTNDSGKPFGSTPGVGKGALPSFPKVRAMGMVPSASEGKIALYSPEFYLACAAGGVVSCGATHTAVTPLDVVKCNMQVDPVKYSSISKGFQTIVKEQGVGGLLKGWAPTLIGYSLQGACKFGFYEYFKKLYADLAGPEFFAKYDSLIFLAGSASAEVIADVALSPWEAVKVRVQTQPGFARGLSDGLPKIIAGEGFGALYKGLVPLWGRQIPYTMMKFAAFEKTVQALYAHVVPKPKEACSKTEQLGVSFAAGYIAGVFCAAVSHPADNLVSKLNQKPGIGVGDVVKEMGLVALFTRGLGLRIVMIGTLTGLQWGIYDAFKVAVGLPTSGGASKK